MRFSALRDYLYASKDAGGGRYIKSVASSIEKEKDVFKNFKTIVNTEDSIPKTSDIPKQDSGGTTKWMRIDDVNCCFVDMVGSTEMSTTLHAKSTAEIYRYFTGTIIKIFKAFDAPYIDVKGDGVFALFDDNASHAALAATVSAKTFVENEFNSDVKIKRGLDLDGHYGISRGTLLVRRIGTKNVDGQDQARNEVWAGKAVNQSAKLASLADPGCILASNRFFQSLSAKPALLSCGCAGGEIGGDPTELWHEVEHDDFKYLKISKGWSLRSNWCSIHGEETCKSLLKADS